MTLVLGLSTSTSRGSVALVGPEGILSVAAHDALEEHAERLFGLVEQVLADASVSREALTAVACDVGPGSFTGVRVGVASAAGMALGLGCRGVGVGSLEAMADAALRLRIDRPERIHAVLDAKKDEVFVGSFDAHLARLGPLRHVSTAAARLELRAAALDEAAWLIGDVVGVVCPELAGHPRVVLSSGAGLPSGAAVARRALALVEAGEERPLDPVYVRPPDARPTQPTGSW